jgi:hypothetical protein
VLEFCCQFAYGYERRKPIDIEGCRSKVKVTISENKTKI